MRRMESQEKGDRPGKVWECLRPKCVKKLQRTYTVNNWVREHGGARLRSRVVGRQGRDVNRVLRGEEERE